MPDRFDDLVEAVKSLPSHHYITIGWEEGDDNSPEGYLCMLHKAYAYATGDLRDTILYGISTELNDHESFAKLVIDAVRERGKDAPTD